MPITCGRISHSADSIAASRIREAVTLLQGAELVSKGPVWARMPNLEYDMTIPVAADTATLHRRACAANGLSWRRPGLWIGMLGLVLALALNWSWLVATGALAIVFGILPCLAVCILHLCSPKKGKI